MKFVILIVIIICLLLLIFRQKSFFTQSNKYYETLKKEWNYIFPDKNRNAAGAKFLKYILDKDLSYKDFIEYNKLYCAVSGSLISPGSKPDLIYVSDYENNKICGEYYRCCWPCSCDIMKYAQVIKKDIQFNDTKKLVYFLVIDNPCNKPNFPEEISRKYFCNKDKLNRKNIYTINDKVAIGILHNSKLCDKSQLNTINNNEMCLVRNKTPINKLEYGMGDIFIKLAN